MLDNDIVTKGSSKVAPTFERVTREVEVVSVKVSRGRKVDVGSGVMLNLKHYNTPIVGDLSSGSGAVSISIELAYQCRNRTRYTSIQHHYTTQHNTTQHTTTQHNTTQHNTTQHNTT